MVPMVNKNKSLINNGPMIQVSETGGRCTAEEESMLDEEEKLITKLQLEYTKGTSIEIVEWLTEWDIGLVYLTNRNLWFVNRKAEKTQVGFDDVLTLGGIKDRKDNTMTKFSDVLKAEMTLKIEFEEPEKHIATTILMSAGTPVLRAFRHQVAARLDDEKSQIATYDTYNTVETKTEEAPPVPRRLLLRNLGALLHLKIKEDAQLLFFLGIKEKDLVNLLIEHSSIMN